MLYPHTELRFINPTIGLGVFATQFIPKGTIVYVKDELEIKLKDNDPLIAHPKYKDIIEKFSYVDQDGTHIISWDNAKYINHCCNCNTMSTGYEFEIALRDILPGEQITDEYGMFNFQGKLIVDCKQPNCRKTITPDDINIFYKEWDEKVKDALKEFRKVDQPLLPLLDEKTYKELNKYLETGTDYRSVINLKHETTED